MKIAVFSSHILWNSHYETELEILQRHLDAKDQVVHYICNGDLNICDVNPDHAFSRCVNCISQRRLGTELLSNKIESKTFKNLTLKDHDLINQTLKSLPTNLDDFKKITFNNFDLGYAVTSSVISLLLKPSPDLAHYRELFEKYTKSSLETYLSFLNHLKTDKPDKIYIFNGRFAHVRAAFRAAEKLKISCQMHERAGSVKKFILFDGHLPHNIPVLVKKMHDFWNQNGDEGRKLDIAGSYYTSRKNGKPLTTKAFTDKQVRGSKPVTWDDKKRNIVIFSSSEYERASIGPERENSIYKNQNEGILQICKDLLHFSDFHFYVRLHPNMVNADPINFDILYKCNLPNLTIIEPADKIDSYYLLDLAWKVITFGSTMGIEATWWNKPSILAGRSPYETMDAVYKPGTHEELLKLVREPILPVCDKLDAAKFGYFWADYGVEYKYYEPTDYKSGVFKGKRLEPLLTAVETKLMNYYWSLRKFALLRSPLEKLIIRKLNA